ncbi:hypothetical protein ILUMI_24699 [Ignelater luminosus]|uniref:Peptidase S1 domain-containing protein n=1 Tax=Ignelater luminosus TaxID=2038154 RepID=A0A8K0C9R5_IGNLU|nr:hypothetical protein ILUMI_24699 [Ignelater luminosus]
MGKSGDRIVNGKDATRGQFPFVVSLSMVYSGNIDHFCGGSIITKYWSLTAAHCLRASIEILIKFNYIRLFGNSHNIHKNSIRHEIDCYKIHSEYDEFEVTNDIALIRVKQSFDGNYEKIINRPPRNFKYVNHSQVTVMGWGRLWPKGSLPEVLQYVEVRLIDDKACQKIYNQCNGVRWRSNSEKGCVPGGSGGPLIQELKQGNVRYQYLIGLVSWGETCGSKFPGVYVRLTKYLDWMDNIMKKNNSGCKDKCITSRINT